VTPHRGSHRSRPVGPGGARRGAACAAALALLLGAGGCATRAPKPITARELHAAQSFPYYTIYWAGPMFDGMHVTGADGLETYSPRNGDSVIYGNCGKGNGPLHTGGCVLPLQITTVVYQAHSNRTLGPQRNVIVRGVPATIFAGGNTIEIYTGRLAIDVYADSPRRALAAALALRPLNAQGNPGPLLPSPTYCPGLWGLAPHYKVARQPDGRLDCVSTDTQLGAGTRPFNGNGTAGVPDISGETGASG
jgi:hypothetical protein